MRVILAGQESGAGLLSATPEVNAVAAVRILELTLASYFSVVGGYS
jgi:hypothetical protein